MELGVRVHLDLDAALSDRRPGGTRELRLVEHDLTDGGVLLGGLFEMEREGPPAGADLEERAQVSVAREPPQAFADRVGDLLQDLRTAAPQRYGDLTPPPEGALGRCQGLHRRLDALAVPADAQDAARAVEAPVLSVVVCVVQLSYSSGDEGQAGDRTVLFEPALYPFEVGCLKLPLDLLVVKYLLVHVVGYHLS